MCFSIHRLNMYYSKMYCMSLLFAVLDFLAETEEFATFTLSPRYQDKKTTSGELWKVVKSSERKCAIDCYQDDECNSFFYGVSGIQNVDIENNKDKMCIGYTDEIHADSPTLIDEKGWVYYHIHSNRETDTSIDVCPEGWVQYKESCYHFSHMLTQWTVATKNCQKLGGYLVEITSIEEETFLGKHLRGLVDLTSAKRERWIGATLDVNEDTWTWTGSGNLLVYTHWNEEQIVKQSVDQKNLCATISVRIGESGWNKYGCTSAVIHYICEKSHQ